MENNLEKTYFAGGCFWGVEYYFQNLEGVVSTKVGYMGGKLDNPGYEEVCSKNTGHAEVVEVTFDNIKTDFGKVAMLFFEIHDPTQLNHQGPDIGAQYRSEIFYTSEAQKKIAQNLINILKEKSYQVVTKLSSAKPFWEAEAYHQKYYLKNGHEPYCHKKVPRFE